MPDRQLTINSSPSQEKAWHILALILSLGRSAQLSEVMSRCTLFHATPALIHSLCLIPNSPVTLTKYFSITISPTAFLHLTKIFAQNFGLMDAFKPWIELAPAYDGFLSNISRKRKTLPPDNFEVPLPKRIRSASTKALYGIADGVSGSINIQPSEISLLVNQVVLKPPLFLKFSSGQLGCNIKDVVDLEGEVDMNIISQRKVPKSLMGCESDSEIAPSTRLSDHDRLGCSISVNAIYCLKDAKPRNVSAHTGTVDDTCKATDTEVIECQTFVEGKEEEQLNYLNSLKRKETLFTVLDAGLNDIPPDNESKRINTLSCDGNKPSLDVEPKYIQLRTGAKSPATELPVVNRQLRKPSAKAKFCHRDGMDPKLQSISKSLGRSKAFGTQDKQHCKSAQNHNFMHIKIQKGNSPKDEMNPKTLPNFESFIVEEEEGSGGYGIVYRARRKSDGTVVAIKCPHANANKLHVNNELRMLERFGGKNFIIQYHGSFKSENSDCFVLEHVEHDRPEVLKKEIDVSQIQWYGYCMFRALASLHKQGIVHRDVKPGNFLFSRKTSRGLLIDFNLAMDLHQKYGTLKKSKVGLDVSFNHGTLPCAKYIPPTSSRKVPGAKCLDAVKQETTKGSKLRLEHKNLKRKAPGQTKVYNDLGGWNKINSQGADGSGITSAKDVTSTRTQSAERLREPLPCHGRKELINLLQEAMRSPNYEALNFPAPMRKRVAAPPGKLDRELVYLTPMPLHFSGTAVAGAGLKNKENGKLKKEGPCAGTKGFRAPEVLFRSQHQGPKLDIWSAGVTLLYLMIGRAPFFGDPEQNAKDIAKLRGSEQLWEVAKLHNRDSSFPADLYDTQFLAPITLRDWCRINTKKRDFLDVIPSSLFDLVDKCLTVNPRSRLSAEDALRHEFFAPCLERLKKQKMQRQELSLDNINRDVSGKQSMARPLKTSR